jgi:eight-cysteine-cluster-containing protein
MRRFLTSLLLVSSLALAACGSSSSETKSPAPTPTPEAPGATAACAATGCSGTVCAPIGQEVLTTCEWTSTYDCYKKATCAMQADGKCGWTKSAELDACIAAGGPAGHPAGDTAPQ